MFWTSPAVTDAGCVHRGVSFYQSCAGGWWWGGLHHLMMRRMVDGANNYGTNPVVPAGKSKAPRIKASRGKAPDSEEGTRRTSERRCGGTSSVSSQVSAPPLLSDSAGSSRVSGTSPSCAEMFWRLRFGDSKNVYSRMQMPVNAQPPLPFYQGSRAEKPVWRRLS